MAESVTIARPYAEAAYRAAKETGALGHLVAAPAKLALIAQDGDMARSWAIPSFPLNRLPIRHLAVRR